MHAAKAGTGHGSARLQFRSRKIAFRRHRLAAEDILIKARETFPLARNQVRVHIARAFDHELNLARSKTAISVPPISSVFAVVATVFAKITPVFTNIPAVFAAVTPATLMPRIADVFACVAAILADIPTILTTVEAILDPIASLVTKRLC